MDCQQFPTEEKREEVNERQQYINDDNNNNNDCDDDDDDDDEKRKFMYGAFQKTHNVLYINKVSYRQNTQYYTYI